MGVRWRAGNAHTAAGAPEWIGCLVERLRVAGVEEITVRLDKGFFSKRTVEALEGLGIHYLLKIPNHGWLTNIEGIHALTALAYLLLHVLRTTTLFGRWKCAQPKRIRT